MPNPPFKRGLKPAKTRWRAGRSWVTPPAFSIEERQAILAALPLANASEADEAIAELEELREWIGPIDKRSQRGNSLSARLISFAVAVENFRRAMAGLAVDGRVALARETDDLAIEQELKRIDDYLSTLPAYARGMARKLRPQPRRGRPLQIHQRIAAVALAEFWSRRTGKPAKWSNRENEANDGGPFPRFVRLVIPTVGEAAVRAVVRSLGR
jgi:hypothetical protein